MLGPGLMRWAGPVIAPPLFRDACLYLDFTSGVYADAPSGVLSRRRSFEDLVTFTRSGTAERINADLAFETVLAGKPRFMHDPAGVLPRRLAVEASETRINANPVASVAGWSVVTSATLTDLALGILGSFPGLKIASQGAVFGRSGPPSWTLVNGQPCTVRTYYMEPYDGSSSGRCRINGFAGAGAFNCNVGGPVGALTALSTTGCSVSGIKNREVLDGIYLCEFTVTNTTGSDLTFSFGVGPDTETVGASVVALAQFVVAGSTMGSDLLNNSSANTTRAAETASSPLLHGGGPFTVLYDCYLGAVPASGFPRVFEAVTAANASNDRHTVVVSSSGGGITAQAWAGNVSRGDTVGLGTLAGPGRFRFAVAFENAGIRASANGSAVGVSTGLSGSVPSLDTLCHLNAATGVAAMPGDSGLFSCSVFSGVLPDADLQSWSALP